MASVSVICPDNTWQLVASNVKQGRIRPTLTNPSRYVYDVVPTGDPIPSPTMASASAILPFEKVWDFQFRKSVDIYIYAFDRDGRIDFDDDAPYTDVFVQDQASQVVIAKFNRIDNVTVSTVETAINDTALTVADVTGIEVGNYIVMYSSITKRAFIAYVLGIAGNVLSIDTPLDSVLPIGTPITIGVTNMAVNGSVTPQIFGLRGSEVLPEGVDITFDITRIIFNCIADSKVDLTTFGDIAGGLTKGLVLRKRDGIYYNIFNVKTNGELAGILYDLNIEAATNPSQGVDGFYARLTFAGQSKIGVVQRLAKGEDLEFIVQDDLSSLISFEVVAEGHVVD